MDELKDKDAPVSYTPEAIVTVSEHGTVETSVGSGACMSSDQVQGSSAEGAQSCNGEDIMVEVLGTSVYVGGFCTSEGGESSNGEGGQETSANVSSGEDRAVNSTVETDACPANESILLDAGASGGEVSKGNGSGNKVEGSLGSSEPVEEERSRVAPTDVVAVVRKDKTVTVEETITVEEAVAVEDIGRVEDSVEVGGEAKGVDMETCVDGSLVVSSSSVETIVFHVRAREEGPITSSERENLPVEVGANTSHEGEKDMGANDLEAMVLPSSATVEDLSGQVQVEVERTAVASRDKLGEDENALNVEGLGEAVTGPGDTNEVRGSSIGAPDETLAVESGKGLTVEVLKDTKMADEVVEPSNDLNTLKDNIVQNPDNIVQNPDIEAKDLSGQMQVQVEKTAVTPTVFEEVLNAKTSLDEQSNVSSAGEVAVMDNMDPLSSEVSATDAIGEQDSNHPGNDQLLKTEDLGGCTVNLGHVPAQIVGGPVSSEVSAMETDAVGEQDTNHSGDDRLLKTGDVGGSTENLGHVHTQTVGDPLSSKVPSMETDAGGEQDTSHAGDDLLLKTGEIGGSTENLGQVHTQTVGDPLSSEVSAMETDAVGDDQLMNTGEIGSSTENLGHVHTHSMPSFLPNEVVAEADLTEKRSQVVVSVPEDNKLLEPEVFTDSNVASDIAWLESSTGEEKEEDNQSNDHQQIGLDGGYDKVLVCDTEVPISGKRDQPVESEECLEKSVQDGVPPLSSDMMPNEQVQEFHQGQEVLVEEQQENGEKVDGISKNENQEHMDDKSLFQPTQVVEAEVTESDASVLLKPNVDLVSQTDTVQGSTEINAHNIDSGHVDPMDSEDVPKPATELFATPENDEKLNFEDSSAKEFANDITAPERNAAYETGLEGVTDADKVYLHGEQDYEVATEAPEQIIVNEEKSANLETLLPGTSPIVKCPSYELPPENDGMFSVSDLVWGKVKSHPWWPGQIFGFTDASEKAMKYHKNDCFLVAYFGDRTFAWNEASSLKPFRTYFSQMEKQCSSEKFQNAINCALEEVSRRVQLELSRSCLPEEAYEKIKFQLVENAGIREESSIRDGSDGCAYISSLEADKLIEYVKALAKFPSAGSDRLELELAKAQLLAFNRVMGHCSLPEFLFCEGLMENNAEAYLLENNSCSGEVIEHGTSNCENAEYASSGQEMLKSQKSLSHKRKHNLRDGGYPKPKERTMSELVGVESPDDDNLIAKRLRGNDAKVSSSTHPVPKPSFKIGECIRRVASQLTGTPTMKSNNERGDISLQSEDANREVAVDPTEYSSLEELLSQLQLTAQEPLKEYNFLITIVNFFSDFRSSIIQGQYSGTEPLSIDKVGGKRKKSLQSVGGFPEAFEFDDMNDTYWTDRVIQNGCEEPEPRKNRRKENQIVLVQPEKPLQENHRRSCSRKRYSNANQPLVVEKPVEYIDKNAPAELIMNFSEGRSFLSETNLNKMFRRFGHIKEIETEVDRESGRARVVFKKASDAEVAFSSAGKFNIFGPKLVVNYELNYSPTAPFKACSVPTIHDHHEMQLDLSAHDHEMQLDFSTNGHEMQLDLSGHDMQLDLSAGDHEMQLDLSNFEV